MTHVVELTLVGPIAGFAHVSETVTESGRRATAALPALAGCGAPMASGNDGSGLSSQQPPMAFDLGSNIGGGISLTLKRTNGVRFMLPAGRAACARLPGTNGG
ncbi:hypothetical protein [Bradyrhizobium sp.]|uniref:hypothetical protein n=1 Tax=Bradyrhizobium sp. TaxID=376 RepID=UPI003C491FAE